MPLDVVATAYGRPALLALRRAVAAAKRGDPLAPVTVIVPANHVGVTARRALASGSLGAVSDGGSGVAAVTFLTVYRLAELLGAARLAAEQRRPVSTPVLAAALRKALRRDPGLFAPVAEHPATEAALVAAFGELSDVSAAGLDALASAGRRAGDVVRLCRQARTVLRQGWYDESDLTEAAIDVVRSESARVCRELGHVIVHMPQDLLQRQARLVAAVAEACPATVVVGVSGAEGADSGVRRSLARLGVEMPASDIATAPPANGTTRVLTASDADDEVRAAVRAVVDAGRGGTPLERIAILFGASEPYGRLVHEHLDAAGISRNGAAVRPLAGSVAGRLLLDLLALPDHDFRRADVVGLLSRSAGGRGSSRTISTAEWQRVSRQAGVVAGRDQWSQRLERLAAELDRRASDVEVTGTDPFDETGAERRREAFERMQHRAQRVRDLATIVVGLIDDITDAGAAPKPWGTRVRWLRRLAGGLIDDAGRRADWPPDEQRAADRVEAALERLASLDGIDDPPSLEVFRRTLELELDADLGRVGRFGEGVLVGPLSFAVGLDLDLVIVLGMAEGTLPAPVHDDSLLPDGERRLAGGELPLRRDRVVREQRRLLAALAAADRRLLCAPRGDLRSSSERVPSRWLVDLPAWSPALGGGPEHVPSFAHAVTHTEFPATEQEYRLRAGAGHDPVVEAGSRVVSGAPQPRLHPVRRQPRRRRGPVATRRGGVVDPARVMGRVPVRLLRQPPAPGRTGRGPGAAAHDLRAGSGVAGPRDPRAVHRRCARPRREGRPSPDQPWSEADHARMRQLAERVCDDYEARGLTGRPVFWRRERAQILALADRFLTDDDTHRQRDGSRPVAAELRFGYGDDAHGPGPVVMSLADGRSLRFRGAADRVDVGDDGTVHVVDYKTGKAHDFRRLGPDNPDERGTKLQLPVYGVAARQFVGRPDAPVQARVLVRLRPRGLPAHRLRGRRPGAGPGGHLAGDHRRRHRAGRVPGPARRLGHALGDVSLLRPRRARRRRPAARVGAQAQPSGHRRLRRDGRTVNAGRVAPAALAGHAVAADRTQPDGAARDRIATALDETLFVEAGAGSGKTRALVDRIVSLVTTGTAAHRRHRRHHVHREGGRRAARPGPAPARGELPAGPRAPSTPRWPTLRPRHSTSSTAPPSARCTASPSGCWSSTRSRPACRRAIEVLDESRRRSRSTTAGPRFVDELLDDRRVERPLLLATAAGVRLAGAARSSPSPSTTTGTSSQTRHPPSPRAPGVDAALDALLAELAGACDERAPRPTTTTSSSSGSAELDDMGAPGARRERRVHQAAACSRATASPRPAGAGPKDNWPDDYDLGGLRARIDDVCARGRGAAHRGGAGRRHAAGGRAAPLHARCGRRAPPRPGELEFHDLLVLARQMLRDPDTAATCGPRCTGATATC